MKRRSEIRWRRHAVLCIPALFLAVLFGQALQARAGWIVVGSLGTTTPSDDWKGEADCRVTVHPDDVAAMTDVNGNFLVGWTGQRGWLTFEPKEMGLGGKPWCARWALFPRSQGAGDSTLDVGVIKASPSIPIPTGSRPFRDPRLTPPALLHLPKPSAGQPDSCWMLVKYDADIWGRLTTLSQLKGTPAPNELLDAVFSWLRGCPWKVAPMTKCSGDPGFTGSEPFTYVWADSGWRFVPANAGGIRPPFAIPGAPPRAPVPRVAPSGH